MPLIMKTLTTRTYPICFEYAGNNHQQSELKLFCLMSHLYRIYMDKVSELFEPLTKLLMATIVSL